MLNRSLVMLGSLLLGCTSYLLPPTHPDFEAPEYPVFGGVLPSQLHGSRGPHGLQSGHGIQSLAAYPNLQSELEPVEPPEPGEPGYGAGVTGTRQSLPGTGQLSGDLYEIEPPETEPEPTNTGSTQSTTRGIPGQITKQNGVQVKPAAQDQLRPTYTAMAARDPSLPADFYEIEPPEPEPTKPAKQPTPTKSNSGPTQPKAKKENAAPKQPININSVSTQPKSAKSNSTVTQPKSTKSNSAPGKTDPAKTVIGEALKFPQGESAPSTSGSTPTQVNTAPATTGGFESPNTQKSGTSVEGNTNTANTV